MTASSTGFQRISLWAIAFLLSAAFAAPAPAQTNPLPSWNDGAAKTAITDFVNRVTAKGGKEFVAPAERIATFDNDGTLWARQPTILDLAAAFRFD